MTIEDVITYMTYAVTGATAARIALHWAREGLEIWIAQSSRFWVFYDKLELTLAYVAGSLAAFGRKKLESELDAPVTKAASPAEGKIK